MAKVKVSNKALSDIDNIEEHFSESAARKKIQAIYNGFDKLEEQSERGRPIPELRDRNIRQIVEANYRIIYHLVDPSFVVILRVFYDRRHLNPDEELDFNY